MPGLITNLPPRRTARGRENDRLVIYLTFSGNDPFSASEYTQTAAQMARQFYQIPGSVTSAVRSVAEMLNQSLVERNLRTTGKGQYIIGRMVLGVLHGSQFVLAQCGPTHVFHLMGKEVRHVHDAQISGRGLGIGQATPLYFSQLELNTGDQMVFCSDLPSGWETSLLAKNPVTTESLRRELLTVTTEDLNAVQVEVLPGKGILNVLKAMPAPAPDAAASKRQTAFAEHSARSVPASTAVTPAQAGQLPAVYQAAEPLPVPPQDSAPVPTPLIPTSQVDSGQPANRFARLISESGSEQEQDAAQVGNSQKTMAAPVTENRSKVRLESAQPVPPTLPASQPVVSRPASQTRRFVSGRAAGELPEIKRPITHPKGIYRGLANIILGLRAAGQKISRGINKFLPNLLPNGNEAESQEGGSSLAFIAIAIPLIVVTVAGLVYARYGRVAQYNDYYNMAMAQAAQAHGQTDPAEVRRAWDSTLYYLDLSDRYQVTPDSLNLRQEAQTALDNLDSIVRLNFSPAIVGGLDHTLQITRMTATNTDLYMLDATHGNVIRASLGSQGYEVDTNFVCGPGQYGTLNVGKLLDIEALQMSNDYNARVMGIDASGTLLYCGFNMTPEAVPLSAPPLGWQGIAAFTLDTDGKFLYVLDPLGNNIWSYQGASGKFTDTPTLFFGQQVPQGMSNSIDLAANNSDLYILFQDGHVTACPASHFEGVPLRCADPATFVDNRPERQPGPRITDAIFNQITFAAAPDPLLYLLEPLTRAVYYFSPRSDSLELRGQFRASVEQSNTLFSGSATSMTISPNRNIFFSIGSQVYYSTNVP